MKNEAEFKRKFKKSIKGHGGYSLSLSAPMIPGIPDLYVIMPGYLPVLLEAKWLGSIPRDKFKRKLRMSAVQTEVIRSCHGITPYSALGLIGFKWQVNHYAVLVPYGNENFESITNKFIESCAWCNTFSGQFDVHHLFHVSNIPRLQLQHVGPLKNNWTGEAKIDSILA